MAVGVDPSVGTIVLTLLECVGEMNVDSGVGVLVISVCAVLGDGFWLLHPAMSTKLRIAKTRNTFWNLV